MDFILEKCGNKENPFLFELRLFMMIFMLSFFEFRIISASLYRSQLPNTFERTYLDSIFKYMPIIVYPLSMAKNVPVKYCESNLKKA